MRALRYHGLRDLRLEDVAAPGELGPGDVLVRPSWCGICGTDLHEYAAGPIVTPVTPHALNGAVLPQIFGHEFAGEVLAVGREVRSARPGDRVSVMPILTCGRCHYCRRGLQQLCVSMACTGLSDAWGGIAELAVLKEEQVTVLPDNMSDEQGALIEPTAVAAYAVERGGVRPGDTVLVAGAGPIGALAALCAAAAGASEVLISEPGVNRRAIATRLGLGTVLDPAAAGFHELLRERTSGIGVDVAIECAGHQAALADCVRAVRKRGVVVQTGLHVGPAQSDPFLWALHEITLVGTWCYGLNDWPRVIAQVSSGKLPVERVVTGRVPVDRAVVDGFDALLDPQAGHIKILVQPNAA